MSRELTDDELQQVLKIVAKNTSAHLTGKLDMEATISEAWVLKIPLSTLDLTAIMAELEIQDAHAGRKAQQQAKKGSDFRRKQSENAKRRWEKHRQAYNNPKPASEIPEVD